MSVVIMILIFIVQPIPGLNVRTNIVSITSIFSVLG
jgi:hypothetical protein